MRRPDARGRRRRGLATLEMMISGVLMAMLAVILGATWAGFGRPTIDCVVRSRVAHEASLAAAALARDLGGSMADPPGRLGARDELKLVGISHPGDARLWLCFDGAPTDGSADWDAPDLVVTYEVSGGALVRTDRNAGTTYTVARHVEALEVSDHDAHRYQVKLTLSYRGLTRTYTWIVTDQP